MKKYLNRIALGAGTVGIIIAGAAAFSAFEAHVINVTAKIENALSVDATPIDFGTVFPQEYLVRSLQIALSSSFLEEENADDVEYVIKQKPKPRPESDRPLSPLKPNYNMYKPGGQFAGQLYPHFIDKDSERTVYCHTHTPADASDPLDLYYINCYPLLSPYLSKTPDNDPGPGNDTGVPAFHNPEQNASGRLAKSDQNDIVDTWTIDLAVPCFVGQCDQGWPDFVHRYNEQANPEEFMLPASLEHKVFGADLWVEVTDISRSRISER